MKVSAAVALLLATDKSAALHTRTMRSNKAIATKVSTLPQKSSRQALQLSNDCDQDDTDCLAKLDQTLLQVASAPASTNLFPMVPAGADLGENPNWIIGSRAAAAGMGSGPAGFFVPDLDFLNANQDAIVNYVNTQIGEWAIVAFEGGKLGGTGYDWGSTTGSPLNVILAADDQPADYFVYDDETIDDILLVGMDVTSPPAAVPTCDIAGYDCECERLPPVDPFSRKPTTPPSVADDYQFWSTDLDGFTSLKEGFGWSYEDSWTPIPDGYWGFWIFLDQWAIFGYEDFEEWNFGVVLRDEQTGGLVDWPIVHGVEYYSEEQDEMYEFIIKIPDQGVDRDIEVGWEYTPIYYDATADGGVFVEGSTPYYLGPSFVIGEPYRARDSYESEAAWIEAVFIYAAGSVDGCATLDGMLGLYTWAMEADAVALIDQYFAEGDIDADGMMTYSELNQWLPGAIASGTMTEDQALATESLFMYFDLMFSDDVENVENDYALGYDEAVAGMLDLQDRISYFYDEFNYYWRFFNGFGDSFDGYQIDDNPNDADVCLTLNELQDTMAVSYDVTAPEIRSYWETWYFETYGITSYYFNWYYLGNGVFDWEGYYRHVPDGPAFDGAMWLTLNGDWDTGILKQAFMWYVDNVCYFSLSEPQNPDASSSGTCTIEGHETIGYGYNVTDINWYFGDTSYADHDFEYQIGSWGPVAEMTDVRYKVADDDFWLWEKPAGHCAVCGEGSGYDWDLLFPTAIEDLTFEDLGAEDQEYMTYDNVGEADDDITYDYDDIDVIEGGPIDAAVEEVEVVAE